MRPMVRDAPPPPLVEAPPDAAREGRVVAVHDDGSRVRRIYVEEPRFGAFVPGQVAELGVPGGDRGFFAVASAPHEAGALMFLVKDSGNASTDLCRSTPGDPVATRGPLGPGFDLSGLAGRDLLLVGAGTAIAPLRSALVAVLTGDRPGPRSVALVYGVRSPADACFVYEHPRWRAAGVRLRMVASRPSAEDRWQGRRGRAQDHLADLVTPDTVALLAGMDAMLTETRVALVGLGVPPGAVRVNLP